MGVVIKHYGDFSNLDKFLRNYDRQKLIGVLNSLGQEGVNALASATPIDSGVSASSWGYEVQARKNSFSIRWTNSNVNKGIPIVILIQYGHATGSGGYVQGRDFINPAIQPIFNRISNAIWEEVNRL